ncbi:peptidoglycan DD-metalloendopeptidase family protein [Sporosarcina obsidiansis]|uniref:peptidoglycan DD-metalloendopeptidase family protein n=1 Tax=Sporosarcina obsidiansis TaxID=2660748 RepID=UPI00189196C9|nr:peptidoglycan DD-metalloendopeptidase family protein [Sporosarcina obsidiansis]
MSYYKKPAHGFITSFFSNARKNPVLGMIRPHQGIDISNADDNTIMAAAAGKVRVTGHTKSAGNYIIITHPNGQETNYSHLSKIDVRNGQSVKQGEKIGVKGTTGNSTGIHLHFEISKGRWTGNFADKLDPVLHFVDPVTKEFQGWLKDLGYDVVADGYYGESTITAVALYQKRNGLTVDGYAGRGTYAHIKAAATQTVAAVDKKEEANRVWVEFSSPTLKNEFVKFMESKGQQDIAVKQGVAQGFSKSWETNEKATPGDKAALGLLGMIREKK